MDGVKPPPGGLTPPRGGGLTPHTLLKINRFAQLNVPLNILNYLHGTRQLPHVSSQYMIYRLNPIPLAI